MPSANSTTNYLGLHDYRASTGNRQRKGAANSSSSGISAAAIGLSNHGGQGLESEVSQASLVGERSTATDSGSDALLNHRSSWGGSTRTRFGRDGRPLLLPKPTLAAHNGRMLKEREWANAGYC